MGKRFQIFIAFYNKYRLLPMYKLHWLNTILFFLVFPLHCFDCHSHYSWHDCDKYRKQMLCSLDSTRCSTTHIITLYHSGQQKHDFVRSCSLTNSCTKESCTTIKDASKDLCEVSCCNTTLCNTDVTPWAKDKGYVLQYFAQEKNSGVITKLSVVAVAVAIVTLVTIVAVNT